MTNRGLHSQPDVGGEGVGRSQNLEAYAVPAYRLLRCYAFDPSLSTQLETSIFNEIILKIVWEGTSESPLLSGPVGEYLEVIDHDPASNCFYQPIDLDDPYVLASNGLSPEEGNPQFHQQMVYAVIMNAIRNFERALGRRVMWSPREVKSKDGQASETFVQRLRVYPHALRTANAFYSPAKKALLFGYFPAQPAQSSLHLAGSPVFTCLSHDIIVHEATHAILDGLNQRFLEPVHPDNLAFHEAFADIVALFQHFTFPDVLERQLAKVGGDLKSQHLLGQLAQEFGLATGNYGALRDALGDWDRETKTWRIREPNPNEYLETLQPHARGSILVATIFDVFLAIYNRRTRDLIRLVTNGTGILPRGELHPDLVRRLASEAAKTAEHVLAICIRALDYCPPNEITFGEYLRALITADFDLAPSDDHSYRVAFIEAFKRRGIYPPDVSSLSVESLRWRGALYDTRQHSKTSPSQETQMRQFESLMHEFYDLAIYYDLLHSREDAFNFSRECGNKLHRTISEQLRDNEWFQEIAGVVLHPDSAWKRLGIPRDHETKGRDCPAFEIISFQPVLRIGPNNYVLRQLIVGITQTREIPLPNGQIFHFRGGATLIFDLRRPELKYAIRRRIDNDGRLERQKQYFFQHHTLSNRGLYFDDAAEEPFAALHESTN